MGNVWRIILLFGMILTVSVLLLIRRANPASTLGTNAHSQSSPKRDAFMFPIPHSYEASSYGLISYRLGTERRMVSSGAAEQFIFAVLVALLLGITQFEMYEVAHYSQKLSYFKYHRDNSYAQFTRHFSAFRSHERYQQNFRAAVILCYLLIRCITIKNIITQFH